MPPPDSYARVRAELVHLIETQLKTLEKETFGGPTEIERREYEDRCDRIRQLYSELIKNGETAAYVCCTRAFLPRV